MKQVVQGASGGAVRVVDVPRPTIDATQVLVRTVSSVISPGTEGAVTKLAGSNLLNKARERPDLVREVLKKARAEGVAQTYRKVRTRLDSDIPLGYSAAGVAVEVGDAVVGVRPGMLVATAGAGRANHAEFQAVPGLLCAPVPEGIDAEDAAFATVAAIALHGFRLAEAGPGARVVVLGLGLIGQLAVRLAQAAGCQVAAIDLDEHAVARAAATGAVALREQGDATTDAVLNWSDGLGADAVLVTAATPSSLAMERTPALCRDRASVVVVGDVGLDLSRTPFYMKELTVRFARSYGPGRYDRSYEEWGVDYPPGFVRWTEGRNLEAVLHLISSGRLAVRDLVTHTFPLESAPAAYTLVQSRAEPFAGIQLTYPSEPTASEAIRTSTPRPTTSLGIGMLGAGAFASSVLVPAFKSAGFEDLVTVASASGLTARRFAERFGFQRCVSGSENVIDDPDVDVVVIATPHDTHGALAAQALRAGKHVFCEKPLALTFEELDDVRDAWKTSGRTLFVGFNRRWSEQVAAIRRHMRGASPLVMTYTVSAGTVPPEHWYHDRRQGGRLIGEVSHFVDTCVAVADAEVTSVTAYGGGRGERVLNDHLVVSLGLADGSVAAITYSSGGHPSTPKERLEVFGGGRTATLLDYQELLLDGRSVRLSAGDKGHGRQIAAFRQAVLRGDGDRETRSMLTSQAATLRAAASLAGGAENAL